MYNDLIRTHNEKFAYINPHTEYESVFFIDRMGITYPDENYLIKREDRGTYSYRHIYVLEYVVSGEGFIECEGKAYKVKAGDFYFLSTHHDHLYYSNPKNPYTKIWINVGGRLMSDLAAFYNLQNGIAVKQMNCRKEFEAIFEECEQINEANRANIYQGVFKHITQILSQLAGDTSCDLLSPASYKIKNYIDENIQSDINLDDIAAKFFFSKSYIINCFKNEFGTSPKQYIIQKKIETAKNMLLETDMSIKAIAESLRFADSHHLSNTFKKQIGVAPIDFRAKGGQF